MLRFADRITLIAALALGAATLATLPAKAQSTGECAAYASDVADAHHRGLVGNVVTLPFDVTGALLTGRTTHDAERDQIYDQAFASCMDDRDVVVIVPEED